VSAPPQDFEQVLTRGMAQWITAFSHDQASRSLVGGLTHDPEHSKTERVARFAGVDNLVHGWQDRDDQCMETLIGAHETSTADGFAYLLNTDQREIEFTAPVQVKVYEV
jgi:hypothetical protein